MKNIIIAGIPRSGKTTLAKRLFRESKNYNLIQQDIIETATNSMYKNNFAKKESDGSRMVVSINISEANSIASELLRNIYNDSINDDKNIGTILDTFDFSMEELKEYMDKGDIIIVLGCSELTKEQFFSNVRKYDTPNDRTYYLGNHSLSMELEYYVEKTKEDKIKCQDLGLTYIDTSNNRDTQLDKAFEIVKEKLKEDNNIF